VVAHFNARGTQTGAFQGIPATGKAVATSAIAIYRMASTKVVEQWLEYDMLGLLQQLGVIPAPEQAVAYYWLVHYIRKPFQNETH
jgi:hypothetical protein